MSGHNKWTQIKRKKGAEDQKRSKLFSMLVKTITVEIKRAGGEANSPSVRKAVERARAANMPSDNIERAIKNAQGASGGSLEEVSYEAYGPGGVALIIEGITDNRNRTSQEIRHLLDKNGGNLATPGSVTWAFTKTAEGWKANNEMELDEAGAQALANLVDALAEHEDIKNIYNNAGLSD